MEETRRAILAQGYIGVQDNGSDNGSDDESDNIILEESDLHDGKS